MPNNRYENQRYRDDDRDNYQSRQQGYRSGQMSQFDDQQGSRGQDWSSGEDQQGNYRQMGGGGYQSSQDWDHESDRYSGGQQSYDRDRSGGYDQSRSSYSNRGSQADYGSGRSTGYRDQDMGGRSYVGHYSGIDSELDDYASGSGGYRQNRWLDDDMSGRYRQRNNRGSYGGNYGRGGYGGYSQRSERGGDHAGSYGAAGYGSRPSSEYSSWRQYGESRGFLEKAGDEIASWFGDEDAARRREMDHRGRGPSGYTRSDERIKEDANEHLTNDYRLDASSITVSVKDGEVTLDGTVDSRNAKRRAEDLVDDLSGVKHVQNNLRVSQSGMSTSTTQTGTSNYSATKKS